MWPVSTKEFWWRESGRMALPLLQTEFEAFFHNVEERNCIFLFSFKLIVCISTNTSNIKFLDIKAPSLL